MNFSKTVLIFVTLVIVTYGSAQEVPHKDLKNLLETKFKKYYIQLYDSGYDHNSPGFTGNGNSRNEENNITPNGEISNNYLINEVKVKRLSRSAPNGKHIDDKGKQNTGPLPAVGIITNRNKNIRRQAPSRNGSVTGTPDQSNGGKGNPVGKEIRNTITYRNPNTGHLRIGNTENNSNKNIERQAPPPSRNGFVSGANQNNGGRANAVRKDISRPPNGRQNTSVPRPVGSVGNNSNNKNIKRQAPSSRNESVSATSQSNGGKDNFGKQIRDNGRQNNTGAPLRVVESVENNSNKIIQIQVPSGNGSISGANQRIIEGKENVGSIHVFITSSGSDKGRRSSNGKRNVASDFIKISISSPTPSNGSVIQGNNGSVGLSNDKDHSSGNGKRIIAPVIGDRSNSSSNSSRIVNGDRGNGRRSIGSVIGDKSNSINGTKPPSNSGIVDREKRNGGNAKRNIGSVIGDRGNITHRGRAQNVNGAAINGKVNRENGKRNVPAPAGKGASIGRGTVQVPLAGGNPRNVSPPLIRSQQSKIVPSKPLPNVNISTLQELPYIDILYR